MGHTGGAGRQEGSSGFDCSLGNALHSFFRIKHIRKRESSVNNVVYKGRGSECQAIRVGGGQEWERTWEGPDLYRQTVINV